MLSLVFFETIFNKTAVEVFRTPAILTLRPLFFIAQAMRTIRESTSSATK